MDAQKVSEHVYWLGVLGEPKLLSVYLVDAGERALIESGPSAYTGDLVRTMEGAGFDLSSINYVIPTHAHLDHAGGVWSLLELMPQAKVIAYYKTARHLIDPTKLKASSLGVLGETLRQWGDIQPIVPEKVVPAQDGYILDMKGVRLKFIVTPGHARHQVAVYLEDDEALFPADALGLYHYEIDTLTPTTAPPAFDLELSLKDVENLSRLSLKAIFYPHFAPNFDVQRIFIEYPRKLQGWVELISEISRETKDVDKIMDAMVERYSELEHIFELPGRRQMVRVDVAGIMHYLESKLGGNTQPS